METYASRVGINVMLLQGYPIAYFSKKLPCHLWRSSTYVRELFAMVKAIKKRCQYLLGTHFIIQIDPQNLREVLSQFIQTFERHNF